MRLLNEILLQDGDASVDLTSEHGLLAHVLGYSIQAVITGTANGTIKLQGSNDPVPDANFQVRQYPVVNWEDIADSTQAVTGAGTVFYNVADVFYNWVRVIYTSSSGTGTITIRLNTKGY
jgi:hypothetical protein